MMEIEVLLQYHWEMRGVKSVQLWVLLRQHEEVIPVKKVVQATIDQQKVISEQKEEKLQPREMAVELVTSNQRRGALKKQETVNDQDESQQ